MPIFDAKPEGTTAMALRNLSPLLVAAAISLSPVVATAAPGDSDAYRAGTDIGALYLSQHIVRMKAMLLLRECGEHELSDAVAAGLPNAIDYAQGKLSESTLAAVDIEAAAQIAKAYLVGYEVGIRTEYRGERDKALAAQKCAAVKALAQQTLLTAE